MNAKRVTRKNEVHRVNENEFSKYMNVPEEKKISDGDISALETIHKILYRGNTCEIKLDLKTNGMKIYEVVKNKR